MDQVEAINRLIHLFSVWQVELANSNKLKRFDINIAAEDAAAELLNLAYGLSLINDNRNHKNVAGFDLTDPEEKLVYQITSRTDTQKIYDNLEKFEKYHCQDYPGGIRFFIIGDRRPGVNKKRCRTACSSFDPDHPDSILTAAQLLEKLEDLYKTHYPKFKKALDYLEQQFGGSPGAVKEKKKTGLFTPLPPMTADLIGRKRELAELGRLLGESRCVLLVNGMGGVGKTEVCKSFFRRHYGDYRHGGWLDYVSSLRETVVRHLKRHLDTAETETPDETFAGAVALLEGLDAEGLWVVDNLDNENDPDLPLLRRLPFRVLVNSRLRLDGFSLLPLEFLSMDECRALFDRHCPSRNLSQPEAAARDEIITLCRRHTLTVELLARTAFRAGRGMSFLLEQLKERGFDLNGVIREEVGTWWHDETVKKQFFHHLETVFDLSGVVAEELEVLKGTALLPSRYMEMELLRDLLGLEGMGALNGLVDKGWLGREGAAVYMHPVVAEVVRRREPPTAAACRALQDRLAKKLKVEPGDNPLLKAEWVVYGESVSGYLSQEDESAALLANNLSGIYWALGQLEKAREYSQKAVDILKHLFPNGHPNLTIMLDNLAYIMENSL